jgi:alkanesulfonate monooxygenase SsuD/methylene tetrahydromethanopterin reductase-like flavin-dependent oxidoreductase (luciferase family)
MDKITKLQILLTINSMQAQDLFELMDLLGDRRFDTKIGDRFKATPAATSFPRIFLLGSSGYSAHLAARLGLPFGFAHHFDMGGTFEAYQTAVSVREYLEEARGMSMALGVAS